MHARPSDRVDFAVLCDAGEVLSTTLSVAACERLASLDQSGTATIELNAAFERQDGRPVIRGTVHSAITAVCVRCLEPLPLDLNSQFALALVSTDAQAATPPHGCEAFLVDGDTVRLTDIAEEELLLVLPDFPAHDREQPCALLTDAEPVESDQPARRPFAGLDQLISKDKPTE